MNPTIILDEAGVSCCLDSLANSIATNKSDTPMAIVGLLSQGDLIASRLATRLRAMGHSVEYGTIDISLYRDDIGKRDIRPSLRSSKLPFSTDDMHVILVDDVLYTGRTIRAALNALFDYGRPAKIELACLIDRGGREVPIQPDHVGLILSDSQTKINVHLVEADGFDQVSTNQASSL